MLCICGNAQDLAQNFFSNGSQRTETFTVTRYVEKSFTKIHLRFIARHINWLVAARFKKNLFKDDTKLIMYDKKRTKLLKRSLKKMRCLKFSSSFEIWQKF